MANASPATSTAPRIQPHGVDDVVLVVGAGVAFGAMVEVVDGSSVLADG